MKQKLTLLCVALVVASASVVLAENEHDRPGKSVLISKPDAFQTLVNPECSHCRDEALRRASQLHDDDRVLSWIRGYSDGGAIPYRFFLNPYRVISDTYGVFVYDADAGFARGFEPSLDFQFHGWRNGVMVMSHKDGSFFSCLTGIAFEGPQKGHRLKAIPTLVTNWGPYLKGYPGGVAYKMFDKYQPIELSAKPNEQSRQSRIPSDARLEDETWVLGVAEGPNARAYPLNVLAKAGVIREEIEGHARVILWNEATQTASAYRAIASAPNSAQTPSKTVTLERSPDVLDARFVDKETGSHWDIAGRAVDGELKGWTLEWIDGTQVRWFAWSAEHSESSIYGNGLRVSEFQQMLPGSEEFPKPRGNLDSSTRFTATLDSIDVLRHTVSLILDGDSRISEWPLGKSAEVWRFGTWGRLDQFHKGDRVWVWFDTDSEKNPLAISFLADEFSEQSLYVPYRIESLSRSETGQRTAIARTLKGGKPQNRSIDLARCEVFRGSHREPGTSLKVGEEFLFQTSNGAELGLDIEAFRQRKIEQTARLQKQWNEQGLPGTAIFLRADAGEIEVMLDHEAMTRVRSFERGDQVVFHDDQRQIPMTVQKIRPWHERTQVLLNANPAELSTLFTGRRIFIRPGLEASTRISNAGSSVRHTPTTSKRERIEWIASSLYCTCGMHDQCAGHIFTLASCDTITNQPCGLAKRTRELIAEKIEIGQSDDQILEGLLKDRGPKLLQPHMSP